jgi:methyltransferase-like protein/2-polyprenyl-3-methyl-5-hydroxy-6-metoxy-1,4-benzoquinol methylase
MSEVNLTSYEEVPYESRPFAPTHPDTLATVATLFGMRPAPPGRCRVLELGCAGAGNLAPMALALPESTFVGLDLSPGHIAEGQKLAAALGLRNLTLRAQSILEADGSLGEFDYIICHGVYSWVPPEVQEKILTICKRNLAPQGVAYVSYNTFPGWHLKGLLRGMLSFHASHFTDAPTRVHQSRAFLSLLASIVEGSTDTYGRLIDEQVTELAPSMDSYLFHEYLEDVNAPLYFHEFAARAAAHGLQYLEEAEPSPLPSNLPAEVTRILHQLPVGLIDREQYFDFIRGRGFRRTLLCHDGVALRRPPSVEALAGMYLTGTVRPVSPEPDVRSSAVEAFRGERRTASTNDPLAKAALVYLSREWPRAVSLPALWAEVEASLAGADGAARSRLEEGPGLLAGVMLQCWAGGMVEAHVHAPAFVLEVSEGPTASPLARLQAMGEGLVTNLRHWAVQLCDFDRLVLRRLDGTRDRGAILDSLAMAVREGELSLEQEGGAVQDPARAREMLAESLEPALERLARSALLVR